MAITDRLLRNLLRDRSAERYTITDPSRPGLQLRVGPGRLTWSLSYRFGGKLRRLVLGHFPEMALAEAEAKRIESRAVVDQGRDPSRNRLRDTPTVVEVVNEYVAYVHARKRPSYAVDVERHLRRELVPELGDVSAGEAFTRANIRRILRRVEARGSSVSANRIQASISAMISWAMDHEDLLADVLESNPCRGMRRLTTEEPRTRILSWSEIRALWSVWQRHECAAARAHQVLLLTGQRRSEVLEARIDEIEWSTGWWTIPAGRDKGRRNHRV